VVGECGCVHHYIWAKSTDLASKGVGIGEVSCDHLVEHRTVGVRARCPYAMGSASQKVPEVGS
jgi:hypothetical protein